MSHATNGAASVLTLADVKDFTSDELTDLLANGEISKDLFKQVIQAQTAAAAALAAANAPKSSGGKSKTECPMSLAEFLEHAEPMDVAKLLAGCIAEVKEFSSGSFGFYHGGKTNLRLNGKVLNLQIGLNVTVIGSKTADRS